MLCSDGDFYGRGYYESHLPQAYGYPELSSERGTI